MCWLSKLRSAAAVGVVASGCTSYDPPPDATLLQPEAGAFTEGELARLEFTEPVVADSIRIRLWPNERDIEDEIAAGTEPIVDECLANETCGDFVVKLAANRRSLTMAFNGELGKPGRPYLIELLPGLEDAAGNQTGSSRTWDMQFKASGTQNAAPIEFDDGVYVVLAQVEEPIPAVLTLISDIRILEDGRFVLAGAEGDEINGAPKNTRDPESLEVDKTDQGWTAYATGFVNLTEDGKRLLESQPFDVILPVGPLEIHLDEVRLFAEIVKNPDTGKDRLDGTLSFESLRLVNGANMSSQAGTSTALIADFVPEALRPEGHPIICEDLCGLVTGLCAPPQDFPGDGFCDEPQ